jgi:hypothetical protein
MCPYLAMPLVPDLRRHDTFDAVVVAWPSPFHPGHASVSDVSQLPSQHDLHPLSWLQRPAKHDIENQGGVVKTFQQRAVRLHRGNLFDLHPAPHQSIQF